MTGYHTTVWGKVDGSRVEATKLKHGFAILSDSPESCLAHAQILYRNLGQAISKLELKLEEKDVLR